MTAFLWPPAGRRQRPRSSVRPFVDGRWFLLVPFLFRFLAFFKLYFRIGTALPLLHWIDRVITDGVCDDDDAALAVVTL